MRRAFVNKLTSGAERLLRLKPEEKTSELSANDLQGMTLPPTPEELLAQENQVADSRVHEKLLIIQHILLTIPAGVKSSVAKSAVGMKIRELLADIRIEQIPEKMLQMLNDLDIV